MNTLLLPSKFRFKVKTASQIIGQMRLKQCLPFIWIIADANGLDIKTTKGLRISRRILERSIILN